VAINKTCTQGNQLFIFWGGWIVWDVSLSFYGGLGSQCGIWERLWSQPIKVQWFACLAPLVKGAPCMSFYVQKHKVAAIATLWDFFMRPRDMIIRHTYENTQM
jgi:hypothetical protein